MSSSEGEITSPSSDAPDFKPDSSASQLAAAFVGDSNSDGSSSSCEYVFEDPLEVVCDLPSEGYVSPPPPEETIESSFFSEESPNADRNSSASDEDNQGGVSYLILEELLRKQLKKENEEEAQSEAREMAEQAEKEEEAKESAKGPSGKPVPVFADSELNKSSGEAGCESGSSSPGSVPQSPGNEAEDKKDAEKKHKKVQKKKTALVVATPHDGMDMSASTPELLDVGKGSGDSDSEEEERSGSPSPVREEGTEKMTLSQMRLRSPSEASISVMSGSGPTSTNPNRLSGAGLTPTSPSKLQRSDSKKKEFKTIFYSSIMDKNLETDGLTPHSGHEIEKGRFRTLKERLTVPKPDDLLEAFDESIAMDMSVVESKYGRSMLKEELQQENMPCAPSTIPSSPAHSSDAKKGQTMSHKYMRSTATGGGSDSPEMGALPRDDSSSKSISGFATMRNKNFVLGGYMGVSIEDQLQYPGHDSAPNVPPFLYQCLQKLRMFGVKSDEKVLRDMWALKKDIPSDVIAERMNILAHHIRVDQMTVGPQHLAYLILDYLREIKEPLIPVNKQVLFIERAHQIDSDSVELAAALLTGLWALPKANYESLKLLFSTFHEMYIKSAPHPLIAAQIVAEALAVSLFYVRGPKGQLPNVKSDQAHLCVRCFVALLVHSDSAFETERQLTYKSEQTLTGEELFVKQATPLQLVETLCDVYCPEKLYSYMFLLTYQYYMTHEELYAILVTMTQRTFYGSADREWRQKRRVKMLRAISRWVRVRGSELLVDAPEVADLLYKHFGALQVTEKMSVKEYLEDRRKRIAKVVFLSDKGKERSSQILWSLDTPVLAQQMSVFHQTLFSYIPISDLINKKVYNPDTSDSDIFRQTAINACNKLTWWLVTELVLASPTLRPILLEKSIRLCGELLKLNNFFGLFAITAALQNATVEKMTDAWKEVPKRQLSNLEKYKAIFEPTFVTYRAVIKDKAPPGVPYLGVTMRDVFSFEDVEKTWATDKDAPNAMVNFSKLRNIGGVLQQVKLYQLTSYPFKPIPEVQKAFTELRAKTDKEIYAIRKNKRLGVI